MVSTSFRQKANGWLNAKTPSIIRYKVSEEKEKGKSMEKCT